MTDAVSIAVIGAVVSLATLYVSWRNGKKADVQAVETQKIHQQTNGHLSKLTRALSRAKQEIASLKHSGTAKSAKRPVPKKKR